MTTSTHTPLRSVHQDDPLDDFEHRPITLLDQTRKVYCAGSGPAVIVMSEMPGISPRVARFARWVRDAGFTVWMPSLFGRDGALPTAKEGRAVFERACISKEFRAFAANESSPITAWLRALAAHAHAVCGGPGVGAIGMCFTGNFALSMMLEKAVLAPVLAQPSLPFGDPAGMHIAPDELARVRQRLEREDLTVLAYRFEGDSFCRAERFAAYQRALGDRFLGRVLPDSGAGPQSERPDDFFRHYVPTPHSVLTVHLVDAEGEPTASARDEILAFFRRRLAVENHEHP
ncbi:dienelactone hydrolase family protein [Pendulispora albinea]|uniref:Dienelactone hydrolase family protein n=1 Tax=Pendulispora albinea TaxID=2741071 RepID=A0ABZ2M1R8_9BACT